jgi:hypothetical protein
MVSFKLRPFYPCPWENILRYPSNRRLDDPQSCGVDKKKTLSPKGYPIIDI